MAGEIVTGRLVRLACARHLRDLENGYKRGLWFDDRPREDGGAADHAIAFFPEFLRHNEGLFAEKPFELSPHQVFMTGSLFGWLKQDGYRRFRHAYIEEGKGDGKSPWAAGCALYGLTMDGEHGAEIYCAAVTRDQAGIAFKDCKHMAEKSVFADRLVITEHNIAYPETNSFIRPVSSEARSLDGKRVFFSILDEVHEHRTPLVIDKMVAGNKGRKQPLNLEITNSGYDRTSVCWQHHEYSRQLLEQVYEDDTWFAYVCQLDPCEKCVAEGKSSPQDECEKCDHWWEEKNWVKANPNLGLSITHEYLHSEVDKALRMPGKALTVKRLNFCIWTESAAHWLPMDDWDACATEKSAETFESIHQLKGRLCYAGLDLADSNDTASLVLVFPPKNIPKKIPVEAEDGTVIDAELLDDPFIILPFIWIPEEMKNRTGQDRTRFQSWISQGLMHATPGNIIDYRYIMTTIGQCRLDYDLQMLAFDRWGSTKIVTDLCDQYGFTVDEKEGKQNGKPLLVKFSQGFASMSGPTKEFANLVISHKIAHDGNAALRWQFGNVVIDQDSGGNQKPDKAKSADKIDAPVAAIMGLELAIRNPGGKHSIYEDRDLLIL